MDSFIQIAEYLFLIYAVAICSSYLLFALISYFAMRRYMKKNSFVDFKKILSSPLAPSISLIAPAYNEAMTIIDNVKSLLSIEYNNYDVVIVNDGSADDTIDKLIAAFHLEKVPFFIPNELPSKKIRGIYKSSNRAFRRLVVVDKENGGKADALNAGISVSNKELVACIDVDCIIQPDALMKMAKTYLESRENVIAIGGVVRIANSCVIEDGRLIKVNLPKGLLARFQVLEYMRAFLLGRMAWSRINGLMLISGAFGLFKRETVMEVGGYDRDTVGEDMELVVRMRRHMMDQKRVGKVLYIPDPLCWTEAPSDKKILSRQRNRWARGTIETLVKHRVMFFNPKYKVIGLISYPYWFFFEFLAPWVETIGLIFFTYLTITLQVSWVFSLGLFSFVYLFAVMISLLTLLAEETSYYKYNDARDFYKMTLVAIMEPFLFHPFVVKWAIEGNIDKWRGVKSWGKMSRTGFVQTPDKKKS
ncbi:MAG: glycosyltransferase [Cyclobacteriaceae bacterium]